MISRYIASYVKPIFSPQHIHISREFFHNVQYIENQLKAFLDAGTLYIETYDLNTPHIYLVEGLQHLIEAQPENREHPLQGQADPYAFEKALRKNSEGNSDFTPFYLKSIFLRVMILYALDGRGDISFLTPQSAIDLLDLIIEKNNLIIGGATKPVIYALIERGFQNISDMIYCENFSYFILEGENPEHFPLLPSENRKISLVHNSEDHDERKPGSSLLYVKHTILQWINAAYPLSRKVKEFFFICSTSSFIMSLSKDFRPGYTTSLISGPFS